MKPINANWTSWELDNKIMLRMKPRNRGVFRGPCTCPLEGEKIVLILMWKIMLKCEHLWKCTNVHPVFRCLNTLKPRKCDHTELGALRVAAWEVERERETKERTRTISSHGEFDRFANKLHWPSVIDFARRSITTEHLKLCLRLFGRRHTRRLVLFAVIDIRVRWLWSR